MLARCYGLRRGEICALTSSDLQGNVLTISKSMVLAPGNVWVIKQPKTDSSYRSLIVSEPLLGVLRGIDGNYIDCNPNAQMAAQVGVSTVSTFVSTNCKKEQ